MITASKIELWKCKNEISVSPSSTSGIQRKMLINKDEIVEFRYHHSVHFRTKDNLYFVLDEETFYKNFEPYGKIFSDVRWNNKCLLKDILEHSLFQKWEYIKNCEEFTELTSEIKKE